VNRKSIFLKNFIVTACLLALCFLAFGITLFFTARSYIVQEKRQALEDTATEMTHAVNAYSKAGGIYSADLRVNISNVARAAGCHIFLSDPGGKVVSCSDMDWLCPHLGMNIGEETLTQLRANDSYTGQSDLNGLFERPTLVSAHAVIARSDRLEGYVIVGFDLSELMSDWSTFLTLFIGLSALLLLLAIAIEWNTSRRGTRPLREMAEAAHSFSKGNFAVRVTPFPGNNEIRELTDAFNSMAEALDQNERSRRELISNVSHELRSPMTSIAGFADGILDGTISSEEAPKYLQTISSETKRLSRLVRSMLDMSRLQEDRQNMVFVSFDHSEMLLQTLLNFEHRINEKHLEVHLEMPEAHLFALGHPDSLTRVVYNLLDNAIKFSEPDTVLSVGLWREDGRLVTRITDRGETIAPEDLPIIFDRFQKTDRSRSRDPDGAGLGLFMVKAILDSHDQDIYVSSENGETSFLFTLTEADTPNPAALP